MNTGLVRKVPFAADSELFEMKSSNNIDRYSDSTSIINRLSEIFDVSNDVDLAGKLGVARGTVSSWRTRGQVPWRQCLEAAISKDVSLDWLITGRDDGLVRSSAEAVAGERNKGDPEFKDSRFEPNPYNKYLVDEYSLVAKGGIKLGEKGDILPFPHNAFPVAFKSKYLANLAGDLTGPCRGYMCTDDAMAPTIPKGWCVLLADTNGEIGEAGVYGLLFRDTGEQTFRRVTPVGDALHLCCDNPSHEPSILDAAFQPLPILVLGRAIWSGGILG